MDEWENPENIALLITFTGNIIAYNCDKHNFFQF
jgi:hypothetical protein